jgi:hypothetical protein
MLETSNQLFFLSFEILWQGILLLKPAKVASSSQAGTITLLWIHEVLRVFHDRLNTQEDQTIVKELVYSLARQRFEITQTFEVHHQLILSEDCV